VGDTEPVGDREEVMEVVGMEARALAEDTLEAVEVPDWELVVDLERVTLTLALADLLREGEAEEEEEEEEDQEVPPSAGASSRKRARPASSRRSRGGGMLELVHCATQLHKVRRREESWVEGLVDNSRGTEPRNEERRRAGKAYSLAVSDTQGAEKSFSHTQPLT
jgi:hypothetical protein